MERTRVCVIPDCARKVQARGWCPAHYQRWKKYGDPLAGPPFRKPRGAPASPCAVDECQRDAVSRGWCDFHYRRWLTSGDPGEAEKRAPGAGQHQYPADAEVVALMRQLQSESRVAEHLGVRRESFRDYMRSRPDLREAVASLRPELLTPEQVRENARRHSREFQRRFRAEHPEKARRLRREQMARYGPEYRHRWNHYNRLRRLAVAVPDEVANEYALILRGDPCCYCGKPMGHIDHIQPIARGGTGEWDNLTAACALCNQSKKDRPLLVFMLSRVAA